MTTPILGEKVPASVSARSRKAPARPSSARPRTGRREVGESRIPGNGSVAGAGRSLTVAAPMGGEATSGGAAPADMPIAISMRAMRVRRSRTSSTSASHSGCGTATSSGFVSLAFLPRGQEFYQHKKDDERQQHQRDRRQQAFARD